MQIFALFYIRIAWFNKVKTDNINFKNRNACRAYRFYFSNLLPTSLAHTPNNYILTCVQLITLITIRWFTNPYFSSRFNNVMKCSFLLPFLMFAVMKSVLDYWIIYWLLISSGLLKFLMEKSLIITLTHTHIYSNCTLINLNLLITFTAMWNKYPKFHSVSLHISKSKCFWIHWV